MQTFNEVVRRLTTFLLAGLLWAHVLLFLNLNSRRLSGIDNFLHLNFSEVVLLVLLLLFSLLAASGLWGMVKSFAYIYFFPFIVLAYGLYLLFLLLRSLNNWFQGKEPKLVPQTLSGQSKAIEASTAKIGSAEDNKKQKKSPNILQFVTRPLRRFTILWCILLLVASHKYVIWVCLIVISLQLGRKIIVILRSVFFFDVWLKKFWQSISSAVETGLAALATVSAEATRTKELENLWNQMRVWKKTFTFLSDTNLISNWGRVLAVVTFGSLYVYIAIIFSFVYFGIASVSGLKLAWPDALVTSIFIPAYVTDLPHVFALRLAGGLHFALVFLVGIGTVMNFFRKRLEEIRISAMKISDRFSEQNIQEKYLILEAKYAQATTSTSAQSPNEP